MEISFKAQMAIMYICMLVVAGLMISVLTRDRKIHWQGNITLPVGENGKPMKVEMGFRDDGIIVWRHIKGKHEENEKDK